MQLSTAANPCCSPRKMTEMQLLYFDSQLNIVLGTVSLTIQKLKRSAYFVQVDYL
jgi:hypothetical protein